MFQSSVDVGSREEAGLLVDAVEVGELEVDAERRRGLEGEDWRARERRNGR